jgi:cell division protein FtsQ
MPALTRAAARALRRLRPAPRGPFETPPRRRDPSPSRLRYRLDRLGRRGYVRFALRRVAPPALLLLAGLAAWQSPALRASASNLAAQARDALVERPEFAVTRLSLNGGTENLRKRVALRLDLDLPVSSLRLDLPELKARTETVPGVAAAELRVAAGGVLRLDLVQRAPAALWRWDGQLHLVDRDGVLIAPLARRSDRPDLPLVVGEGADRAMAEALALWDRARPLHDRLRGLVRIGERRWTLALASGIRVQLPAQAPERALARLLALDRAEDLLDREVSVIDLRVPDRPTLRLTPRAVSELMRARALIEGEDA